MQGLVALAAAEHEKGLQRPLWAVIMRPCKTTYGFPKKTSQGNLLPTKRELGKLFGQGNMVTVDGAAVDRTRSL
jgi:hypothetical protein